MKPTFLALGAALLASAAGLATAQIKAYTLDEMVTEADDAVFGEIVARRAFRVDHPVDGPELYFTTLTVEGTSLSDGTAVTVDVTYHGGFVSEDEGVFNSEAPVADDVRLGNRIVAFYRWADDMGGGVAANVLLASHGGLYRTVTGPADSVVLGRGQGYAIDFNVKVADLGKAIRRIRDSK